MTYKITPKQKQIIIGELLGDGCIETANGRTFRLKIEHSYKQQEYVDWLYAELENLASAPPKVKLQTVRGKEYKKYWFNTAYSASYRFYYHQFYPAGKKVVPKLIHRWLTPLTLAIWYMDDGSIKSKVPKAKILKTQGFDLNSLKLLQTALLRNFSIKTILRQQKEGKQIYILASEVKRFETIIKPYVLECFNYKLG